MICFDKVQTLNLHHYEKTQRYYSTSTVFDGSSKALTNSFLQLSLLLLKENSLLFRGGDKIVERKKKIWKRQDSHEAVKLLRTCTLAC